MTIGKGVLVIGSGAREHALARALAASPSVTRAGARVWVAPGNAGTESRVPLERDDPEAVVALCRELGAGLVVVGPEAPLCRGVVDALAAAGIRAFGPTRAAAELEGSKAFLKRFARDNGILTADFEIVERFDDARRAIARFGAPVVIKASGLCAGKGVVVAATVGEAEEAARAMLEEDRFGEAGRVVVVEQCLFGWEASVHAISDGERWMVLPVARDHKRIGDGDTGPNTGGMGVIAPASLARRRRGETDDAFAARSRELSARIERDIIDKTLRGMARRGTPMRGVLFAGLMITPAGDPYLLEHNVRFGDPECEALLSLLDGDVARLLDSAAQGELDRDAVTLAPDRHATVVVLAAAGYPASPRKGDPIEGVADAETIPGVAVLHAGTAHDGGRLVTAGGRVLAVTATGTTPDESRERAYRAADRIHFEGKQLRRDIGVESTTNGEAASSG